MYSPIHQDDINAQTAPLLRAATVPATVVNWAGDEGVSVQEWCAYAGELVGRTGADAPTVVSQPILDTLRGSVASSAKRAAFTGPCAVDWRTGTRRSLEARGSAPSA
jgi:hypothetical protein